MIIISLYDIVNSIDNFLGKNVKAYETSLIDNIINEVNSQLYIQNSSEKSYNFPENTLFVLDRYEFKYAICENMTTGKMVNIPKSLIDSSAKDGDILKLKNGTYIIDHLKTQKQKDKSVELFEQVNIPIK